MPFAATHVIIVIVLLELYREYFVKNKQSFPLRYVLIGGIAGLLPDLDIIAYYFLSFFGYTVGEVHRTFSHNLFVPLFFAAISIPFWKFKNKELGERHLKLRNVFFVIAFSIFVHLVLDTLLSGNIMPIYPFSAYSLGFNLVKLAPAAWQESILPSMDAAILVLWLFYIERKHKISRFL